MKKLVCLILAVFLVVGSYVSAFAIEESDTAIDSVSIHADGQEKNVVIVSQEEVCPMDITLNQERTKVNSEATYNDFLLKWETNGDRDILKGVEKGAVKAEYEYDEAGSRVIKNVNGKVTAFSYADIGYFERVLVSENRDGLEISYRYDLNNNISTARLLPVGFVMDGVPYLFLYDDDYEYVIGIANESGQQVVQYEYSDGIVSQIMEKTRTETWEDVTDDLTSIGNINRIRYRGYYYDEETGWYFGERYFDSVNDRFVDGKESKILNNLTAQDINGIAEKAQDSRSVLSFTEEVDALYDECMGDAAFGKAMSKTATWYNSLSDIEIAARLVYAENTFDASDGYDRTKERRAEGWVVYNRIGTPGIIGYSSLRSVCTGEKQFSSIWNGGSYDARNPVTTKESWKEAVYIACALYLAGSRTELNSVMPRPTGISNQLYFYALDGFEDFLEETSSGLKYNGSLIEDVTIVEVSYNITDIDIITHTSDRWTHNIFYNLA